MMEFTRDEQQLYWKCKWLREHRTLIIILCVLCVSALLFGFFHAEAWVFGACSVIAIVALLFLRNRMLIYIDDHTSQ